MTISDLQKALRRHLRVYPEHVTALAGLTECLSNVSRAPEARGQRPSSVDEQLYQAFTRLIGAMRSEASYGLDIWGDSYEHRIDELLYGDDEDGYFGVDRPAGEKLALYEEACRDVFAPLVDAIDAARLRAISWRPPRENPAPEPSNPEFVKVTEEAASEMDSHKFVKKKFREEQGGEPWDVLFKDAPPETPA